MAILADAEGSFGEPTRRRLSRLMAARLGLTVGALLLALVFVGAGREGAEIAERGLYGTLALGFAATLVYASVLRFVRRFRFFAALQLGTDLAIVTSLVTFSGGAESIFGFLYLPITVYGAMLFDRRGAYGTAAASSAGFGAALVAAQEQGLQAVLGGLAPGAPLLGPWLVHTVALLLVALLASTLARELRVAGAALLESTSDLDRLRDLHQRTVESLTSGLLTTDAEGRITSFNPEAERIADWNEGDALGRELDQVIPGLREQALRCVGEGGRPRARMTYESRDGNERHLGLAASSLREGQDEGGGTVVIFQDLTDVVAMESELRRSERLAAAGQLAADMAHEIRNPLAAISGSIEMLQDGLGHDAVDEERRRLMGIVLREVERLDRLIGDFLQYARPGPAQPGPVVLAPMVEDVVEMFRTSVPDGIEVDVAVPPHLTVWADPRQLRQLLWNLALNASQAMPDGGRLGFRATPASQGAPVGGRNTPQRESEWVEITVSDTGVGIAPESLQRIFDPFFTTRRGGSGLGLATVHRVVEGNGGVLRVESEVGKGSAFVMLFPGAEVDP